jgi:hypothetical protein
LREKEPPRVATAASSNQSMDEEGPILIISIPAVTSSWRADFLFFFHFFRVRAGGGEASQRTTIQTIIIKKNKNQPFYILFQDAIRKDYSLQYRCMHLISSPVVCLPVLRRLGRPSDNGRLHLALPPSTRDVIDDDDDDYNVPIDGDEKEEERAFCRGPHNGPHKIQVGPIVGTF